MWGVATRNPRIVVGWPAHIPITLYEARGVWTISFEFSRLEELR